MASGVLLGLALAVLGPSAAAQEVEPYVYARPGQPTITIYVWGAVGRPGIWHVEQGVSLIDMLSLVNPQLGANLREEADVRRTLRIYRGGAASAPAEGSPGPTSERELVFEAPLEEVLSVARPPLQLQHGDVLAVEAETQTRIFTLRNFASIIGTAATLLLLVIRLSEL